MPSHQCRALAKRVKTRIEATRANHILAQAMMDGEITKLEKICAIGRTLFEVQNFALSATENGRWNENFVCFQELKC